MKKTGKITREARGIVYFYQWGLIRTIDAADDSIEVESDNYREFAKEHCERLKKDRLSINAADERSIEAAVDKLASRRRFGSRIYVKKKNGEQISIKEKERLGQIFASAEKTIRSYEELAKRIYKIAQNNNIKSVFKLCPLFDKRIAQIIIRWNNCQNIGLENFIDDLKSEFGMKRVAITASEVSSGSNGAETMNNLLACSSGYIVEVLF